MLNKHNELSTKGRQFHLWNCSAEHPEALESRPTYELEDQNVLVRKWQACWS